MKTILSGTSSSIRTKLWWNSHWMVLFQNCVRQSRSTTKMAATVQLCCYWKQLWSRWAITGSWEPLVYYWTCSHPKYNWNTAGWTSSNNHFLFDYCWFFQCKNEPKFTVQLHDLDLFSTYLTGLYLLCK